jgi:sarcosine oxidase subunit beta
MLPKTADVVIIGGGVMGVSAAYHLAQRGCTDVVLLEKGPFLGMEATGKCAGGIRYQFSTEINVRLSQLSLPMLERFREELGQEIDLHWPGYLFLLDNEADLAAFQRNVAMQNRLGRAVADHRAAGGPRPRPAALHGGHSGRGLARGRWAGRSQRRGAGLRHGRAAAGGAKTLTSVEATGIRVESGRVTAVETSRRGQSPRRW